MRTACLLFLLLASCTSLIHASRIRAMNLEMLTRNADRIFQGRCTQVRVGRDPVLGQTVTFVTFMTSRTAKGTVRGPLTIKLLGDQSPSAPAGSETQGLPRFEEGEEVILFLHAASAMGLTSPVGFGQGKFRVTRDRQGRQLASNSSGNAHLLERLSPTTLEKLGNGAMQSHDARTIPADLLLDLAGSIERRPGGPR